MAFWNKLKLDEMSDAQWESLCDRCGQCCLHKFEDIDTGAIQYSRISCKLLGEDCNCKHYEQRKSLVSDCVQLTKDHINDFKWLPSTCAYRLLSEGKPLFKWHPLISKNPQTVVEAGISMTGKFISEEHYHPDELEERIINWVIQS